jgi:ABC-type multidrug transport system fused ATPase/permease subunit
MNLNFGEILTRAWQITWKYKVLWIFGILAGCTSGSGGGGGGNTGFSTGPSDVEVSPEMQRFLSMMEDFVNWVADNLWLFIGLVILVVLVLTVISTFLGTIGRVGLIKGAFQAEMGMERLVFGELLSASMPYFWRVLGLSLLIWLGTALIFVPVILLGLITLGLALVCLLPLICLFIPVGFAAGIIVEQANRAIVLEDLRLFDGVRRGWEIFKANLWPLIVMGLILFGITLVLGIVIALPVFIVVFPTIFAFAIGQGQSFTPLYIALACICLYVPVSWVLNGILTTYTQTGWTLAYLRLTQKPEIPEAPVFADPNA